MADVAAQAAAAVVLVVLVVEPAVLVAVADAEARVVVRRAADVAARDVAVVVSVAVPRVPIAEKGAISLRT